MRSLIAAGTLGLAFAASGTSGDQPQEPSPREKEKMVVVQACSNAINLVLPPQSGTAHRYAMQGCVFSYYAGKEILAHAPKR